MRSRGLNFRRRRSSSRNKIIVAVLVVAAVGSFAASYFNVVHLQASKESKETDSLSLSTPRFTTKSTAAIEPGVKGNDALTVTPSTALNSGLPENNAPKTTAVQPPIETPVPSPSVISSTTGVHTNATVTVNGAAIAISSVFTHPVPETNSAVSGTLQKGQEVMVVSEAGGWYLLSDGTYVWGKFLQMK